VFSHALEFLSQYRILSSDPHRAGVEVAFTHHDAAECDQRCGGETNLFRPEQGADHYIPARFDAAVRLQHNATAQIIHDQGLMGFCDAQLPWQSGMLDAG